MPSSSWIITGTGASSMAARNCRSLDSNWRRATYWALTSVNTSTAPVISPAASWMGAALSDIWYSAPSRASSRVSLDSSTTWPVLTVRATGSGTGSRVPPETMTNTSPMCRPLAVPKGQPVSRSATGFIRVTRPARSVAITASPMERRVTARFSRLVRRASSAWRRAVTSEWVPTKRSGVPSSARDITLPRPSTQMYEPSLRRMRYSER